MKLATLKQHNFRLTFIEIPFNISSYTDFLVNILDRYFFINIMSCTTFSLLLIFK